MNKMNMPKELLKILERQGQHKSICEIITIKKAKQSPECLRKEESK